MNSSTLELLADIVSSESTHFTVQEIDLKRKTATFLCETHGQGTLKINKDHKYVCKLCAKVEKREAKKVSGALTLEYYQAKTLEKFGEKYQIQAVLGFPVHRRLQVFCQKHGILEEKWESFIAKGCQKCYKEDNYVPKTREILTYDHLYSSLYIRKLTVEEVGVEHNLSANTIRQYCRNLNLKLPKRQRGINARKK